MGTGSHERNTVLAVRVEVWRIFLFHFLTVKEKCVEGSVSASWKQGLVSPDLLELKWFTVCFNTNPQKMV